MIIILFDRKSTLYLILIHSTMKIRNHRTRTYFFYPSYNHKDAFPSASYQFKYKTSLMKFLSSNIERAINGTVMININEFCSCYTSRKYLVWYRLAKNLVVADLRLMHVNGKKCLYNRKPTVSKQEKKFMAFSGKVINLMLAIDHTGITPTRANKLITLFIKQGFTDFIPNEDEQEYIDACLSTEIPWGYWCDRCDFVRCKVILEYFKKNNII